MVLVVFSILVYGFINLQHKPIGTCIDKGVVDGWNIQKIKFDLFKSGFKNFKIYICTNGKRKVLGICSINETSWKNPEKVCQQILESYALANCTKLCEVSD